MRRGCKSILTLQAVHPVPDGGSDQYKWDMQEQLNPTASDERFFASWRMRLLPESTSSDVQVLVATDGAASDLNLLYSVGAIRSTRDAKQMALDTTVFHTYRLESLDMTDYTMSVDGELAWEGYFGLGTTVSSLVLWGDGGVFGASGSQWDYFRFGVMIPEPGSGLLALFGLLAALRIRKR